MHVYKLKGVGLCAGGAGRGSDQRQEALKTWVLMRSSNVVVVGMEARHIQRIDQLHRWDEGKENLT